MTTPLRAVLEAVEHGATTVPEIAECTGFRADVVQAAVEHLRRMNRIGTMALRTSCAGGSCASCRVTCAAASSNQRDEGS